MSRGLLLADRLKHPHGLFNHSFVIITVNLASTRIKM